MPTRPVGVYPDGKGGWYLKVTLGSDHVTGRREQLTRRGFRSVSRDRRPASGRLDASTRVVRPIALG